MTIVAVQQYIFHEYVSKFQGEIIARWSPEHFEIGAFESFSLSVSLPIIELPEGKRPSKDSANGFAKSRVHPHARAASATFGREPTA